MFAKSDIFTSRSASASHRPLRPTTHSSVKLSVGYVEIRHVSWRTKSLETPRVRDLKWESEVNACPQRLQFPLKHPRTWARVPCLQYLGERELSLSRHNPARCRTFVGRVSFALSQSPSSCNFVPPLPTVPPGSIRNKPSIALALCLLNAGGQPRVISLRSFLMSSEGVDFFTPFYRRETHLLEVESPGKDIERVTGWASTQHLESWVSRREAG